jgi:hypothetical protein
MISNRVKKFLLTSEVPHRLALLAGLVREVKKSPAVAGLFSFSRELSNGA